MKRHQHFVSCALLVIAACGPGKAGLADGGGSGEGGTSLDDGASSLDDDGTDTSVPLVCSYLGQIYEDGDEFETADGCITYACDAGSLIPTVDSRITVAGDLVLATQDDVDANLCLAVVEGSLSISGTAADLTPLAQLSRVDGALSITASEAVTLNGLQTLAEVGGSIVIADNASLTTLAFQVYMSVFGDVTIQNNDALASLAGAEFIGQCATCSRGSVPELDRSLYGGGAAAAGDDAADSGEEPSPGGDADPAGTSGAPPEPGDSGLEGGEDGVEPQGGTFYGNILIADNDVLNDITALSNLYYAWADVRFRTNAVLTSLSTMQLSQVQGSLEVSGHLAMNESDAQSFATAIDVWGELLVCGNLGGMECQP